MRGLRLFAMTLACLGIFSFAMAPRVAAVYNPFSSACSTPEAKNSPTCGSLTTTNPLTGSNGLLMKITYIVAAVTGFTAILVILIAGSRYMTAGGDTKKASDARNALIGALVGLCIVSFASLIIMFIVSRIE